MARRFPAALSVLLVCAMAVACGETRAPAASTVPRSAAHVTLRLGYEPTLPQAGALVGIGEGIFAHDLGPDISIAASSFAAGPAEVDAMFSGRLDAAYMDPNSAVSAFVQSRGQGVAVVSGAAIGGAALVVQPSIHTVSDLRGRKVATPQLGGTQDVALRHYLATNGLNADDFGGGDVSVVPQDNASTVDAFASGAIDGAWVPEPYVTLLEAAGGQVLVDESRLWPSGRFTTALLVVTTGFLNSHSGAVNGLVRGQVDANAYLQAHPSTSEHTVAAAITSATGHPVDTGIVAKAWSNLSFTNSPVGSAVAVDAQHAHQVGLLASPVLDGLYDLDPLNDILTSRKEPTVKSS